MGTTTNTPSKGGVLPEDFRFFTTSKRETEPKARRRLTFEQRMLQSLVRLERRRIRLDERHLALEEEERADARALRQMMMQTCLPIVVAMVGRAITPAKPEAPEPSDPGRAPHE